MISFILRRFGYVPIKHVPDAVQAAWRVIDEERAARRQAELIALEWAAYAGELVRKLHGLEQR